MNGFNLSAIFVGHLTSERNSVVRAVHANIADREYERRDGTSELQNSKSM
jgi:hypothetical protein